MKKTKEFIEQATINITEDRAATKALLMGLMKYMQVSEDRHKEVGIIAAKYLETLQRANEQLVKVGALQQKLHKEDLSLSTDEREEIFNEICQVK